MLEVKSISIQDALIDHTYIEVRSHESTRKIQRWNIFLSKTKKCQVRKKNVKS